MKRSAFTLIELIFVIVILGILAAIAIPRLGSTVSDANVAKGRSDVASIRSAIISERQTRLLRGDISYASQLDNAGTGEGEVLFDGNATNPLLTYGIVSKNADGHWMKTSSGYTFKVDGTSVNFAYNSSNGTFDCNSTAAYCSELTQ